MRIALSCAALVMLAGCSVSVVVPPEAWTFDPTRPASEPARGEGELAAHKQRVAGLELQRTEIRTRIAGQPDVSERQRLYEQLHRVGMELSPLERRTATAATRR